LIRATTGVAASGWGPRGRLIVRVNVPPSVAPAETATVPRKLPLSSTVIVAPRAAPPPWSSTLTAPPPADPIIRALRREGLPRTSPPAQSVAPAPGQTTPIVRAGEGRFAPRKATPGS